MPDLSYSSTASRRLCSCSCCQLHQSEFRDMLVCAADGSDCVDKGACSMEHKKNDSPLTCDVWWKQGFEMGFGTTKAAMAQNPGRAVAHFDVCIAVAGWTTLAHKACPSDNHLRGQCAMLGLARIWQFQQGVGFWQLLHAACQQTHLASWQDMRVRIVIVHLCR